MLSELGICSSDADDGKHTSGSAHVSVNESDHGARIPVNPGKVPGNGFIKRPLDRRLQPRLSLRPTAANRTPAPDVHPAKPVGDQEGRRHHGNQWLPIFRPRRNVNIPNCSIFVQLKYLCLVCKQAEIRGLIVVTLLF